MKKGLLLLLAFTLLIGAFALVGCGGGGKAPADTGDNGEALPADVQKIKDAGVLKVGVKVDVPNFGYKDPATNEIDGLEIDFARAIAKEIIGDENAIALEPVTAKTRGPLLDNGQLDLVLATFTIKPERLEQWNFSNSYYTDEVGVLVKKNSGITGVKDLGGKKIGVAQGATSKDALEAEATAQGATGLQFFEFATYPEINAALESGRVDGFCVDKSILSGYLSDDKVILEDGFSPQEYGAAAKKGNDGLTKLVNDVLADLEASGEMDKLLAKWNLK